MFVFSSCGFRCSASNFGCVLESQNMGIPEIDGRMFPRFLHKICIGDLLGMFGVRKTPGIKCIHMCPGGGEKAKGMSRLSLPRLFVTLFVCLDTSCKKYLCIRRGSRSKRLTEYSQFIILGYNPQYWWQQFSNSS